MKIVLARSLRVPTKDGRLDIHPAGAVLSVYHRVGRGMLYRRDAKWIAAENGDPHWVPVAAFRQAMPEHDTMIRSALNK